MKRIDNLFGFSLERDFIPKVYENLPRQDIFRIFLLQYNASVDESLKIPLIYAKKALRLKDIFDNYINNLLYISPLNPKKVCRFSIASNLAINSFKTGKFSKFPLSNLSMKAARFINLIYNKEFQGLAFEADILFFEYVFDKVTKRNKNLKIKIKDGTIFIQKNGKNLALLTYAKSFINCPKFHQNEIEKAFEICDENTAVYILFPRQNSLKRHICVQNEETKVIKIVPYSINNILKKDKNENSNNLRKFNG
ncbi:MAG: hypothetical protein MR902_06035 [Campylobacter sp.]|nr:hypothetical protein [Campylobacter sp.]